MMSRTAKGQEIRDYFIARDNELSELKKVNFVCKKYAW